MIDRIINGYDLTEQITNYTIKRSIFGLGKWESEELESLKKERKEQGLSEALGEEAHKILNTRMALKADFYRLKKAFTKKSILKNI